MASNKQEYLKRYLSHAIKEENAPKKKKKIKKHSKNIKIFDDDLDLKKLEAEQVEDLEIGEEAPLIVGEVKGPESQAKWKAIIKEETPEEGRLSNTQTRHDSDSDQTPPRNQLNASPARNQKQTYKGNSTSSQNKESQTKSRHDSDSDHTPPRKEASPLPNSLQSKISGKRNARERNDSDSNFSPPRASHATDKGKRLKKETNNSGSDLSPPRPSRPADKKKSITKKSHDSGSDLSPPRPSNAANKERLAKERHSSGSDLSPPRRIPAIKEEPDSDLSPPRRRHPSDEGSDLSPSREKRRIPSPDLKKAKSKEGGLMKLNEHRKDMEARKAQEPLVDMSIGKDAAPIVRKKKLDPEEEKKQKEKEELEKIKKQKYAEWGRGLKQAEKKKSNVDDALAEMAKPFARYKDDADLDSMLREQERSGDPMLEYIRKKQDKDKTKGGKSRPKYQGPPPPQNRFNILPGYRWDGVDRSNGFEAKLLSKQAEKIANEEEAYKWSVQDM